MCTGSTTTLRNMYFSIILAFLLISFVFCEKDKCETCKEMSTKFREGMERTSGHNFGGGNTDWEETRLGSFANSETRLVDIMEKICSSTECHFLVEEHEEDIETWWFNEKSKGIALDTWLCIDTIKVCCPKGKFGTNCEDCPGGVDSPCGNHGNCEGDGSRSGNGECECDKGYTGKICDECQEGFYQDPNNASKLNCLACHESCDGACSDGSPKGCETCKDGWEDSEEHGCVDKNECEANDVCESNKYCVNTAGSFTCEACDVSCAENCSEGGAKGCLACNDGYEMTDIDGCKDKDECSEGVSCEDGQHCSNTPGSYECLACDKACAKCTERGSETCTECNQGYEMTEKGCEDKDECSEGVTCEDGKHCSNTPGAYECLACHKACAKCAERGFEKCTECNKGYEKTEKGCEDINECKTQEVICPGENERCKNTDGSHLCKCSKGFKRKDGKCVKKKKKSSGKKSANKDEELLEEVRKEEKPTTSKEDDLMKNAGRMDTSDVVNDDENNVSKDENDVIDDNGAIDDNDGIADNDVIDDNDGIDDDQNDDADLDNLMREEL